MTISNWFAFLAVSLAATFSPGPAVLLAMSTALSSGARNTAFSSAGNVVGVFLVSCFAVTGAGVLLRTSEIAFTVLKLCGAAYLVYLGCKQWRNATLAPRGLAPAGSAPLATRSALFRRGLFVALSNPKAILFFTAVFPQFIQTDGPRLAHFLLLSLTFVACSLFAHLTYVLLARTLLSNTVPGNAMIWINRISGLVFIALGCAMLTLSARPPPPPRVSPAHIGSVDAAMLGARAAALHRQRYCRPHSQPALRQALTRHQAVMRVPYAAQRHPTLLRREPA